MLTIVFPMSLERPGLLSIGRSKRINNKEYPYLVIGVGKESTQRMLAKWALDNRNIYDFE